MDDSDHVIVCGVDGSTAGRRALEWAVDEARTRGWVLRAVTAWTFDTAARWGFGEPPDGVGLHGPLPDPAVPRRHAEQVQEAALAQVPAEGVRIDRVVTEGRPSDVLCAAGLDAEMLVIGSHGHSAVRDVLVGSTSERVLHHAACPVVVLPDPRHAEKEIKHWQARRGRART